MSDVRDPLVGRTLAGRYTLIAPIASGGMGAVYVARQEALQREVAVKVIKPGLVDDKFRARFEHEALLTSKLEHPHVVTVHDYGIDGDIPFLVFEKLDGEDLASVLARGPLSVARGVHVLRQIAEALVEAARVRVVHRDLKPKNVFLCARDHVKVLDFGIAKITDVKGETNTGHVVGSSGYIAPERFDGERDDPRSDLYSLGCLAFDIFAGRGPFLDENPLPLAFKHMQEPPPRLTSVIGDDARATFPRALDELVMRMLAKTAEVRPHASEVADELRRIETSLVDGNIGATPATTLSARTETQVMRAPPRRRAPLAAIAVVAAFVVAATIAVNNVRSRAIVDQTQWTLVDAARATSGLASARDPSLSADGAVLAYAAPGEGGRADIFVVDANNNAGGARNLTHSAERVEEMPAVSPDGAVVAFVVVEAEGDAIWIAPTAGGDARRLVAPPASSPRFAPSGRELVFSTGAAREPESTADDATRIGSVDVVTGAVRLLVDGSAAFSPAMSSRGIVAFMRVGSDGKRDVCVKTKSGSSTHAITDDAALDFAPQFVGDDLLFLSDRDGISALYRVALDDDGAPRGAPVRVVQTANPLRQFAIAADGAHVAYVTRAASSEIVRRSLDVDAARVGSASTVFARAADLQALDASDDGAWLVVESHGVHDDILMVRPDGTETRLVTDDAALDRGPRFLAGSDDVVFASTRAGKKYALFRTSTSTIMPLSSPTSSSCALVAPTPAPNAQSIVVAAFELGCNKIAVGARELPVNAVPIAWANDDTLLAIDGHQVLHAIDVATGNEKREQVALGLIRVVDQERAIALDGHRFVVLDLHDLSERALTDDQQRALTTDANVVAASFAVTSSSSSSRTLYVLSSRADSELWHAKITRAN